MSYQHYKNKISSSNNNNGLKDYNSESYYNLRDYYNNTARHSKEKTIFLYVLMLYAFNNDIRLNSKGEFNLPVGKTDFNTVNYNKLKSFINHIQDRNFTFINADFRSKTTKELINKHDFIYLDPPYLITEAVYNKSSSWSVKTEIQLIELLKYIISINKKFVLSNIISKFGVINEPLTSFISDFSKKLKLIDIDYHYKSASYNKLNRNQNEREVLITNL